MKRNRRWALSISVTALALLAAACGGDDEDVSAVAESGTVAVSVQEWAVAPEVSSVDAGELTFEIENTGEETHEFVVLKTDLGLLDLPTGADGSLDEEGGPVEVVDEVEGIPAGGSESLTVDLEPGSYVLVCNIVEEDGGETESHFANGMKTAFTVK